MLSEPWDSRMNREQLVNSEQTAALQETLHVLPTWLIDTHKHTEETWLGVPHSPLFFGAFVSPGWLLGLDLVNRQQKAQLEC